MSENVVRHWKEVIHESGTCQKLNIFERYLTLWVALCIFGGIGLGKIAPQVATTLDSLVLFINVPVMLILVSICKRTSHWFSDMSSQSPPVAVETGPRA